MISVLVTILRVRALQFFIPILVIQHALALHGIPHQNMNLVQCCRALIHHVITGDCFGNHLMKVMPLHLTAPNLQLVELSQGYRSHEFGETFDRKFDSLGHYGSFYLTKNNLKFTANPINWPVDKLVCYP